MTSPQTIALFGGSFDPPHRGHVAIARAAADKFHLTTILFTPAGHQPLKPEGAAAPYADRLAMVALACQADPRFAPSSLEAPTSKSGSTPNFTVDTLTRLAATHPEARIVNLVGADSFHDLARWRDPERLLALAKWIVVSRPGSALADPAGLTLTPAQRARVHLLDEVHEEVSATTLRQRLHAGQDCTALLPPGVPEYITRHGLYR